MASIEEITTLLLEQNELKSEILSQKLMLARKLLNTDHLTAEEMPARWETIEKAATLWIHSTEERNK